ISAGEPRLYNGSRASEVGPTPTRPHLGRPSGKPSVVDAGSLQFVLALELPPCGHGHALDLIDLEVAAFELQPVGAAGDRPVDDRRLLTGVGPVHPEIGPRVSADGHPARPAFSDGIRRGTDLCD